MSSVVDPIERQLASIFEDSLSRTFRVLRRRIVEGARAEGLTYTQYVALRYLSTVGESRMSELACYLDLTNSATTALIEKLETRQLAHRRVDPADGRVVLVSATAEGERVGMCVQRRGNEVLYQAFERLSVPERHMAVGGLAAFEAALQAVLGEP